MDTKTLKKASQKKESNQHLLASEELPTTLLGRDKLLNKILILLKKDTPFFLTGMPGSGKTSIIKWAVYYAKQFKKNSLFIDAYTMTYSESVKAIFLAQDHGKIGSKTTSTIEKLVISGPKVHLFIDGLHVIKPKFLGFIKQLNDLGWCITLAALDKLKEDQIRLTWGKETLTLAPLPRKERHKLAIYCVKTCGSSVSPYLVEHEGLGIPGRMWSLARGVVPKESSRRVEGEEVDITLVILFVVGLALVLRYLGIGKSDRVLYMVGSLSLPIALLVRLLVFESRRKR